MAEKDFFEWYLNDVERSMNMHAAIEMSRDKDGKVDPYKATGIAMGMGYTSGDDFSHLAGHLGAAGAFDAEPTSGRTGIYSVPDNSDDWPPEVIRQIKVDRYEGKHSIVFSLCIAGLICAVIIGFFVIVGDPDNALEHILKFGIWDILMIVIMLCSRKVRDANVKTANLECIREQKKMQSQKQEAESNDDSKTNLVSNAEDVYVGTNCISTEDVQMLSEAGYDPLDLELMEPEEQRQAMEEAGVDVWQYDFED